MRYGKKSNQTTFRIQDDKGIKVAFTLAEVLITLAVIGIVAALTLSAIINNYQKQRYVSGLQEAYSILNRLTKEIMAVDGVTSFDETTFFNKAFQSVNSISWDEEIKGEMPSYIQNLDLDRTSDSYRKFISKELSPYLKFSLYECQGDTDINCHVDYLGNRLALKREDKFTLLQLDNGMTLNFVLHYYNHSEKTKSRPNKSCGWTMVDVNGFAKPNVIGRDSFVFWLGCNGLWYPQESEIYIRWYNGDEYYESLASRADRDCPIGNGFGCAQKIINDGWKMKY